MATKFAVLAAIAVLAALLPAAAQARSKQYYVSLGDSLSVGYQPNPATGAGFSTTRGYVDDLFKLERRRFPGLVNWKLGCGGEDSVSIYTHPANCAYPPYGSQLQAAEAFLRAHRGHIGFVTIDIGANDVSPCVTGSQVDLTCVGNGLAKTKANVPKIAKRLRRAAGPKTQIVGMTYYDPYLQLYTLGGSSNQSLAQATLGLADQDNNSLAAAYRAQKIKVADVATAFQTDNFSQMTTLAPFGQVPVDVAQICTLTWMCSPAPVGQNIHAKDAGYTLIARTFADQIERGRP